MGRHPGELLSSLEVSSSTSSSPAKNMTLSEVLDNCLSPPRNGPIARDVVLVAMLALACLNFKPQCRPTMKQVSQQFLARKGLLAKLFSDITLGQLMMTPELFLDVESEIETTEIV